jgi:hypothetical protein
MVKFLFGVLSLIVLVFVIALTFIAAKQDKDRVTVKYDCRMLMGNWHPDVPKAAVEECKKRIKE